MMIVIFSVRVVRGAAPASVRPPPTAKDDTAQTTARTKTVATELMERTDTDEETEPADFKSQSVRSEKATVARSQSSVA